MSTTTIPQLKLPLSGSLQSYAQQSRRPLVSLLFVLPLLVLYEGGILLLGSSAIRNGADIWLRQFLDLLGFGQYFLLPVLTVGILLAWHHATGDQWKFRANVLYGMSLESALLGLLLVMIAMAQSSVLPMQQLTATEVPAMTPHGEATETLGKLIGFAGAGIYEEVLFRLMLLPVAIGLFSLLRLSSTTRLLCAVIATSLIFSAAHYVGAHGEVFNLSTFTFRTIAGLFFSALFLYRGFGITAGTHALYDIFVGMF